VRDMMRNVLTLTWIVRQLWQGDGSAQQFLELTMFEMNNRAVA
jgi:hypothetical protein